MTTMTEMMGRASDFFVTLLTTEMGVKAAASWGSGCLSGLLGAEAFMAEQGDLLLPLSTPSWYFCAPSFLCTAGWVMPRPPPSPASFQ